MPALIVRFVRLMPFVVLLVWPIDRPDYASAGAGSGVSRDGAARNGTIVSDDFHGAELDTTVWRFDDPVGDVLVWMTGTNAVVSIPGGMNHDLGNTAIRAPRLMQVAANQDFDVEGKFDSKGSWTYQGHGIIAMEDADTYLRFEVIFGPGSPVLYAAYVDAGVRTTKTNQVVGVVPPYLRVTRTGNSWQYRYSYDGVSWVSAVVFTQGMTVTEVGVYFYNAPIDRGAFWQTPAFVGNVDYFFNRAAPIVPEDGGDPTVPTPPVVESWYGTEQEFGHLGIPQRWVNIVGRVWDTEAISWFFYRLNNGSSHTLTMGPNDTRLVGVGDYNIEIDFEDLIAGPNEVLITAIDVLGERRDTTVTVNYTGGVEWALPDTVRFETAGLLSDVAHVVDGRWSLVTGEGVRVDSSATGYDRLLVLGDYRWKTNYEVLLPMTIHAASLGGLTGIGLGLGWQGHTGTAQPRVAAPFEALTWIRDFPANPTLIIEHPGVEVAIGYPGVVADVRYLMRTRSQSLGGGLSRVRTKFWRDGTPEPVDWDLSADVATRDGSVFLLAHRAIVTFGNVTVSPIPPLVDPFVLTVGVIGNGTVEKTPDQFSYSDGDTVILTAAPGSGWEFDGWSGGLSGSENPDTIVIVADTVVTATFTAATGVVDPANEVDVLTLRRSYPNPFRGHIVLEYGVPESADVEVWVFDAAGRTVYRERIPNARRGWNTFVFRGTDSNGNALPSGVYFCRFKTAEGEVTRKIAIVR